MSRADLIIQLLKDFYSRQRPARTVSRASQKFAMPSVPVVLDEEIEAVTRTPPFRCSGPVEYRSEADWNSGILSGLEVADDSLRLPAPDAYFAFDGSINGLDKGDNVILGSFSRSSAAYKSDGTQVAANVPRFELGKFGQAVMLEEGTTNLLTENQSSVETDLTGLMVAGNNGNKGTLSRITSDKWHGVACAQVVVSGYLAGDDISFSTTEGTSGTPVSPSTPYAFSVYVKAPVGIPYALRVIEWNSSGGFVKDTSNLDNKIGTGQWERLAGVLTTQSTTAYVSLRVMLFGDGVFLFDGLQIEQKTYATSWHLGGATRSSETLTIPTTGVLSAQEGTIEFWFTYLNSPYMWGRLFTWGGPWSNPPASDWLKIYFGYGWGLNRVGFSVAKANSSMTDVWAALPQNIQAGQWCYVAVRWHSGNMQITLYNAATGQVATGSGTKSDWPTLSGYDNAYIGLATEGYSNHLLDSFRVSKRALSDAEIQAKYQQNIKRYYPTSGTWTSPTIDLLPALDTYFAFDGSVNGLGKGDSVIPGSFSRPSVAYKQDGTQVATNVPRFEAGKFGQALMLEEGTTNLISNSSFESDTSGWTLGGATVRDTSTAWHGGASVKIAKNKAGGGAQTLLFSSAIAASASASYTLSVFVKPTGQPANWTVRIAAYDSAGTLLGYAGKTGWTSGPQDENVAGGRWYLPTEPTNIWSRFVAQLPSTPVNTAWLRPWIFEDTSQETPIYGYVDAWQLEQKPYPTSFIDGTRSPETLTIPTAGVLSAQEGTIELWFYYDPADRAGGMHPRVYGLYVSNQAYLKNQIEVYHRSTSPEWLFRLYGPNGEEANVSYDGVLSAGWHYLAQRWNASEHAVFIDGVKIASKAVIALPTAFGSKLRFGETSFNYEIKPNLPIDDLRISRRALSDAEIQAKYQQNINLYNDVQRSWLDWFADMVASTSIAAAIRFSADGITWDSWQYVTKKADLTGVKRYAQISFTLETTDSSVSPILYQAALYAMRFSKWGMAQYGPAA